MPTDDADGLLQRFAAVDFCYLTTLGRRSGRPHRIEIWFAVHDATVYMLAGGRERSDWVRNLTVEPRVTIELGDRTFVAMARVLAAGTAEDALARRLLVEKYSPRESNLEGWGRSALPVAFDLPSARRDASGATPSCW